ncbi:hypothetical protein K3495_g13792 [Podosphaera aphanis]|nr:hypothetical protein K3495_g13792 [Podosphaera aphanis]
MKQSILPYLRTGIAYRKGVSKSNYEEFVPELQDLANELESSTDLQLPRGPTQSSNANPQNLSQPWVSADSHSSSPNAQLLYTPTPYPSQSFDPDGDTIMSDINTLQGQMQTLLATLKGNGSNRTGGSDMRRSDSRPFPPPIPQGERNRRIDAGVCERCGSVPSHRWSDCRFKNFQSKPTPRGYKTIRKAVLE